MEQRLTHLNTKKSVTILSVLFIFIFAPRFIFAQAEDMHVAHRFWSPEYKSHFFTVSEPEKDNIRATNNSWCYEGAAFMIPSTFTNNTLPVHRFWSKKYRSHFYTISSTEKENLFRNNPDWSYEGVKFYAYSNSSPESIPVHRFWSKKYQSHFYTISSTEKENLFRNNPDWSYEGVKFYASRAPVPTYEKDVCKKTYPEVDLGPIIGVGLSEYTRDDLSSDSITISSLNHDYQVVARRFDDDGDTKDTIIAERVDADDEIDITYDSDGKLEIGGAIDATVRGEKDDIVVRAADAADQNTIIFKTNRDSTYDTFRYSMRIRYAHKDEGASAYDCATHDARRCIWLINDLPLELYTWGMGEITGTAADIDGKYDEGMQYNMMMTTIYRSYGLYKITESVEHKSKGFDTVPDPSDQIYRGHVWEEKFEHIRDAAENTRGKIVTYDDEPILTPFGSWTDGRTRHFTDGHFNGTCKTAEQKKKSDLFPYLLGVNDSPGKHPSSSTCALAAAGNHMVGISAQGALGRALDDEWDWERITEHYLSGVNIDQLY